MVQPILESTTKATSGRFPDLAVVRAAQQRWQSVGVQARLAWAKRLRLALVNGIDRIIDTVADKSDRSRLELLTSELLPFIDACRFLERQAAQILAPRRLSRRDRPMWLVTKETLIERVPLGVVLVLAPSNYPFFLPGVQTLQALIAGNAVVLKPGRSGQAAAECLAALFFEAGLPDDLLTILNEDVDKAREALAADIDKAILTGSAPVGRHVLQSLAGKLVPATMELSGHDAVFVRNDADIDLVVRALVFGLLLNKGETCIAPRRIFVHRDMMAELRDALTAALSSVDAWAVDAHQALPLADAITDALRSGAQIICGSVNTLRQVVAPVVLTDVTAEMRIAREPRFCALMVLITVASDAEAIAMHAQCDFALGAAVFSSDENAARTLGQALQVGIVTLNDLIAPSADPRIPFGGRRQSGFGVTRGAEGLLELTVPKVTTLSRGHWRPHFDPPRTGDYQAFKQFIVTVHGQDFGQRVRACLSLVWALFYANAVEHRRRRLGRRTLSR